MLKGVSFEVNISTSRPSRRFPLLPTIDWEQYALDHGCTADDIAAAAEGEPLGASCEPFGVKTGRIETDPDTLEEVPVTEDFFYDGLFIRAAVRLAQDRRVRSARRARLAGVRARRRRSTSSSSTATTV